MLLRRIIEHVKAQNWMAVGLDFFIVVIGILIAFQITEWNAARAARAEEDRILEQLQREVAAAIEIRTDWLEQDREQMKLLGETILAIQQADDGFVLDPEQCTSAAYSHGVTWEDTPLVTADELISAGRINLLRDSKLRTAILKLHGRRQTQLQQTSYWTQRNFSLTDEHAEAFPAEMTGLGNFEDRTTRCIMDIIRNNQTILNRLMNNRARRFGHSEWAEEELEQLLHIASMLEREPSATVSD